MTSPAIAFDRVTLALGGRRILENVSLSISEGEFIGVLGANGAGKTTLMRAILGLVRPVEGSISVLGRGVARGGADIGYMPQSRSNIDVGLLSGGELVAGVVNGAKLGLPWLSAAQREDVKRALELVGAGDLARRPIRSMSGGERQRLLLAQALVGRPRLLLLDEPLLNLDPSRQASIVRLVKSLQTRLKLTVLFTSHELNPILEAMNRVLYVGSGEAAIGTVEEVITAPVLSRLYGTPIEVVRIGSRYFVMSEGIDLEREAHRHEGHDDHDHGDGAPHDHGHHGDGRENA